MDKEILDRIVDKHRKWLMKESGGRKANLREADLREADLRWADLREADLREADLRWADLRWADLREADLRWADLREADLREADLRGANLDFSCFPLWCGTFDVVDDGRLAMQLLSHIARLDIRDKKVKAWVKRIPESYRNEFCDRHGIEKI